MATMNIRFAQQSDCTALAALRHALWPEGAVDEHEGELEAIVAGAWSTIYPYVLVVAVDAAGALTGFAEVTLRSRADGCDPSRPVGYLEGWYVAEPFRRTGVGSALLRAAEEWARAQGCIEMASDTWIDREVSQRAHEALGFEVVDRCVTYRKTL
jgi:aminoglycoside 6'-N-acetyltransferase I